MIDYIVRFANYQDIPSIMEFIDSYWRKGHILASDRNIFEWQYVNNGKVNMVLGTNSGGEIEAILGYIPYDRDAGKDYSLALWKAREGTAFLGIKLLLFLLKEESHRTVFCNGINVKTSGAIYRRLGIHMGKLNQWYRLQSHDNYKIANIKNFNIPDITIKKKLHLSLVHSFGELMECASNALFIKKNIPFKSKDYFSKRYFNHPKYKYLVYKVLDKNDVVNSAIVLRVEQYENSCALRIIDFVGKVSDFYCLTEEIDIIAKSYNAEYVDIYEYGLDDKQLIESGWLSVGSNENIIPNYFAPYVQSNIEINICMTDENIVLFKGDGDQDRPN